MDKFEIDIRVFGSVITVYVVAKDMDTALEEVKNTPVLDFIKDLVVADVSDYHGASLIEENVDATK